MSEETCETPVEETPVAAQPEVASETTEEISEDNQPEADKAEESVDPKPAD